METIPCDVAIVGAGGAGLRAAIALAQADPKLRVALISLEQVTGKKRSDTDAADEYALDRYLRKLRDYPRDIALWVLEQWDERTGDAGRWFPKTAELRDACNALFVWRRALLPALQRYTDRAPEPEPVEAPEDRAEGAARLRALAAQTAAKAAEQERGYFQIAPDRRGAVSDLLDRRRAEEAEHVERVLHGEAG